MHFHGKFYAMAWLKCCIIFMTFCHIIMNGNFNCSNHILIWCHKNTFVNTLFLWISLKGNVWNNIAQAHILSSEWEFLLLMHFLLKIINSNFSFLSSLLKMKFFINFIFYDYFLFMCPFNDLCTHVWVSSKKIYSLRGPSLFKIQNYETGRLRTALHGDSLAMPRVAKKKKKKKKKTVFESQE